MRSELGLCGGTVSCAVPSALVLERVTALIERKEELEVGTYSTAHSIGLCYLVSTPTCQLCRAPTTSQLLQLAKYNNHFSLLSQPVPFHH